MIVLDASAVVELVLGTEAGSEVARRIADPATDVHAPHLVDVEVVHVVRRYVLAGRVPEERGRLAIECLSQLDIERHRHDLLLPRMWQLRHNLTAYDAASVAPAESLGAVLLSGDRRLAASFGHSATVEVVDGSPPS